MFELANFLKDWCPPKEEYFAKPMLQMKGKQDSVPTEFETNVTKNYKSVGDVCFYAKCCMVIHGKTITWAKELPKGKINSSFVKVGDDAAVVLGFLSDEVCTFAIVNVHKVSRTKKDRLTYLHTSHYTRITIPVEELSVPLV